MAQTFPFIVDGVEMPCPSAFTWGMMDISKAESGRGEDALMNKNTVAKKRKLNCKWVMKNPADTAKILRAVTTKEYFQCTYHDALENAQRTMTAYVSDRSAPVKYWWGGHKYYESVEFDIIER